MTIKINSIVEALKLIPKDAPKAKFVAPDVNAMITPLQGTLAKDTFHYTPKK